MKWHLVINSFAKSINNLIIINSCIMPKRNFHSCLTLSKKIKLSTLNSPFGSKTSPEVKLLSVNLKQPNMQKDIIEEPEDMVPGQNRVVEYLDTPVKSEADKKDYRVIKLQNGLIALLISDTNDNTVEDEEDDVEESCSDEEEENEESLEVSEEENDEGNTDITDRECSDRMDTDTMETEETECDDEVEHKPKQERKETKMAACGLCVGVGSFSDPPEIQGLAHFLEHMVFMGSEKYPQENDFESFITQRGGSDNASTECEHTTFFFEVHEKYLLESLERFTQFFISPLMNKDAINREREAVESEFQMALPSDVHRKEQLFCSFARPNHPASKFMWGNLITLRDNITDDKLYEELHAFRKRHYSAHRMTLAIQARLPLDTLEEYVVNCFSGVPSNYLPPIDFTSFKGTSSFDTPRFHKIYKIKPVKDTCQMELTWIMPSLHHLYKSKPHQYVSWILGHEGKGSLISYLRKKMWCLDIFTGNGESGFEHSSMYALFSLSVILTDEGHEHLKEVLDAIFSYINMMKREGPQQRIYDEIYQIEETNFRFTDEVSPAEYVENLCENMHLYAPVDYITGSELYFEYNPESIRRCMNDLSSDKVNITIFDKKFDDEKLDKVEPWFKTKYTVEEIPQEWSEKWKNIEPRPEFHLPESNIFIATNFTVIPVKPQDVPKFPMKIQSTNLFEVWFRPDPKFRLPECYIYFSLISSDAPISPKNAAMMDLFVEIVKQLLVEDSYAATAAGLNYTIAASTRDIVIKLNGLSQKLPLLLSTIMKYIANCSDLMTEDLFNVMKEAKSKSYYNTFLKPGKLVKDVRLSILMLTHWSAGDKHAALSKVDFEQFMFFVKHFTDHIYIQCLVQGNMTKEDVIENVKNCVDILKCTPLIPNTIYEHRVTKIPVGTHCCRIQNFNSNDINSVVMNYYQSDITNLKSSVLIELIIMLMEEPLFNQLRTQEQLGYNVFCLMRDTFGILGYSITVFTQANKFSTETVDERIEEFMKSFKTQLAVLSDTELDRVKDSLIKLKQCADIHLKDEVDRNWAEIISQDYIFDRLEREISAVEKITLDNLTTWVNNHTEGGENFRKLSVQVVGTYEKNELNEDIGQFKPRFFGPPKNNEKPRICIIDYGERVQYPLKYLTDLETDVTEKPVGYFITDIEDYKRSLYVYPVIHPPL